MADVTALIQAIDQYTDLKTELAIEIHKSLPGGITGRSVVPVRVTQLQTQVVAARASMMQAISDYNQAVADDIAAAIPPNQQTANQPTP